MKESRQQGMLISRNRSVTGRHTRNSGGNSPGKDSVVGLEARPVRAGNIGRDTPGHAELTEIPPMKAGGVSSRPIHGEITASWFQADRTGLQAMGTLSIYSEPLFLRPWSSTLTEGLHDDVG